MHLFTAQDALFNVASVVDFSFRNLSVLQISSPLFCPGMSSSLIVGCWCLLPWLSRKDKEFFLGRKERGEQ